MTNEEREIIARFVSRVGGAPQGGGFSGGAPAPVQLPPVDREADEFIAQQFGQYPEARYRITQMAFVQEAALVEAQNRIKRLEWELDQARRQAAQPQQSRGLFGGLFGGGSSQQGPQQPQQQYAPPPPPPQYAAPQYQPGMFQRSGSGFLGSALTTAAGVAGGLVVGNALMDLFSGPHGGIGGGFGGGFAAPGSETVVNNYYEGAPGADPWGAGGAPPVDPNTGGPDPWSQGGAPADQSGWGGGAPDQGNDPGWDQSGTSGAGGTTGGGGGWDDTNT
jgi:hypothetical protein